MIDYHVLLNSVLYFLLIQFFYLFYILTTVSSPSYFLSWPILLPSSLSTTPFISVQKGQTSHGVSRKYQSEVGLSSFFHITTG